MHIYANTSSVCCQGKELPVNKEFDRCRGDDMVE